MGRKPTISESSLPRFDGSSNRTPATLAISSPNRGWDTDSRFRKTATGKISNRSASGRVSAVRLCGNNTGNDEVDHNWGNAVCLTDGDLAGATAVTAIPEVQLLVLGHPELAM